MSDAALTLDSHKQEKEFHTGRVSLIASAHGFHDIYSSFLAPMLPVLIERFSITLTQASLLSVFYSLPSLSQPFLGYIADRVGSRWFVIFAPAITGIVMSSLNILPSYWLVVVFLMLSGLNSAALHSTGPVMIGNNSGSKMGLGMGFWMGAGEIARVMGPLIIVSALKFLSPQNTIWLASAGIFMSLFLYLKLRDYRVSMESKDSTVPAKRALKLMMPVLLPVSALVVARAFAFISLTTFLPTYMTQKGASLMAAGASLSLMEAAGVAGAFAGGILSDKLGRNRLITLAMIFTGLFLIAFTFSSGWWVYPILLGLGFSLLSVTPVFMALVIEGSPGARALANGIFMAVNFGIVSLASLVVGQLADRFGLSNAYLISAAIILLAVPLVFFIPKKSEENTIIEEGA